MRKCLLISYYYPPMQSIASLRPEWMHRLLPEHGWDCGVLTHYIDNSLYEKLDEHQVWRALDVSRASKSWLHKSAWVSTRVGARILDLMGKHTSTHTFWKFRARKKLAHIIRTYQPDVILSTYSPIDTLELGLWAHREFHIPLVADFRDGLMFESIDPLIAKVPNWALKCKTIEREIAVTAAGVITVTDPITRYFADQYDLKNVSTITNGYSTVRMTTKSAGLTLQHWYQAGKINIVFTGRIGMSDQSSTLVFYDFIEKIRQMGERSELCIHFFGWLDKEELNCMEDLIDKRIVRCHGNISHEETLAVQGSADWLLLFVSRDRKSVATGKLFEYLQARRPIIAISGETAAKTIIEKTGSGAVIDSSNPDDLKYFLCKLAENPRCIREQYYHPDENEIEKYDVRQLAGQIAEVLNRAVVSGK